MEKSQATFDQQLTVTHSVVSNRFVSPFFIGLRIYLQGLCAWRIWLFMAEMDIRRRYRRTVIGPFWVTLSIAIFIGSMGVIFTALWHSDMKSFLPYFASGFIIWSFISSITTEACGTFIDASALIKQTSLPYTVYANNIIARNVMVLMHHLTVYLVIMFIFSVSISFSTLLFIPGMLVLCGIGSWMCLLLGLAVSRYRDLKQIIMSLLQIAMFLTPIFWESAQLGTGLKARLLITYNPLYHFIQIVRAPMLGGYPTLTNWMVAVLFCIGGWIVTLHYLGQYKKHIVFWL